MSRPHPTFQSLGIQIDEAALDLWKGNQLADAEALLTAILRTSQNPRHHILAGRALVRARLQHWDDAISDAAEVWSSPLL